MIFLGVFWAAFLLFSYIKGPKHPLNKSYSKCFRRTQIRWVIWRLSTLTNQPTEGVICTGSTARRWGVRVLVVLLVSYSFLFTLWIFVSPLGVGTWSSIPVDNLKHLWQASPPYCHNLPRSSKTMHVQKNSGRFPLGCNPERVKKLYSESLSCVYHGGVGHYIQSSGAIMLVS